MKLIPAGIALLFCFFLNAQKPETVYSIAKEMKEISWYETQQRLWKEEVTKNPENGTAWMNYYMATRALKNLSDGEKKKAYMDQSIAVVNSINEAMPGSFEYYFTAYSESGVTGGEKLLMKAAELRPEDPQIFDELMICYEITGDKANHEKYAQKMFESNEVAAGMLNWAYNLLSEVDKNAVVFTGGDNDTYATWIIQAAKNYRKDVTVVNSYLILLDDYRNRILKDLGYGPLILPFPNPKTQEELEVNNKAIFTHFFEGKRPVYIATTVVGQFTENWEKKLYLTGLAYKYSNASFDNSSEIRKNYEKRYQLDYLKEVFSWNIGNDQALIFNGTYLPSMINLYQLYERTDDFVQKAKIEELMTRVAEQTGQQGEVFEVLGNTEKPAPFLSTVLDIKKLEKTMVPLMGKIYIDKNETTNESYTSFLANLKRSGQTELYKLAFYDSTQWEKKFTYSFNDPMTNMYGWHPAYGNYPVVNISWEAANAYCAWLTKQYNLQRNRTYTQVVFRLPTEKEWRTAAGSGDAAAITPFPNNNIKTCKDCYLGNIKTGPDRFFDDGGFHTVKVSSYAPNTLGLYNTLGNVSEMTAVKGKAYGGSWYNLFEETTFDKTQKYDGPDPGIGFRIVMEIIEE